MTDAAKGDLDLDHERAELDALLGWRGGAPVAAPRDLASDTLDELVNCEAPDTLVRERAELDVLVGWKSGPDSPAEPLATEPIDSITRGEPSERDGQPPSAAILRFARMRPLWAAATVFLLLGGLVALVSRQAGEAKRVQAFTGGAATTPSETPAPDVGPFVPGLAPAIGVGADSRTPTPLSSNTPLEPKAADSPRLTIGTVGVMGGAVPDAQTAVSKVAGRFRGCYRAALRDAPNSDASIVLVAAIARDGSVQRVTSSPKPRDSLGRCLTGALAGARFAPPAGGNGATITVPIRTSRSRER